MAAGASQVLERELVATALVTGAIVFAALALVGQLPARFGLGGLSVEYREMAREDFAEGVARVLRDYTISYGGDIVRRDRLGRPSSEDREPTGGE